MHNPNPAINANIFLLLGLSLLILFTGISYASDKGVLLPDFGDEANLAITPQEAKKLGREFYQELQRKEYVETDTIINEYIKNLGNQLALHSDDPEDKFTFFVIPADVANAFATPGGYIGIFEGLVLLAESEDEVAGVVSHEIAHVTQNHMARRTSLMKKVSIPILLGMLGVLAATSGNSNAAGATMMGGVGLLQQKSINYTRNNEYEADRIGIRTLSRAGYDPMGMASFFSRMQQLSRNFGEIPPQILLTHPVNASRIAEAKGRIDSLPALVEDPQNANKEKYFRFIQQRMRVNLSRNAAEAILFYKMILKNRGKLKDEEKYGYAVALATTGAVDQTNTFLNYIDPEYVEVLITITRTESLLSANRIDEALTVISAAHANTPRDYIINRQYIDTLIHSEDKEDLHFAKNLISELIEDRPEEVELYKLKGRIENLLGQTVSSMQNLAIADFLLGDNYSAIRKLQELLDKDVSSYHEAKITARIEQIRNSLNKKELRRLDKTLRGLTPE